MNTAESPSERTFKTQALAIDHVRRWLAAHYGGQIVLFGLDGTVVSASTCDGDIPDAEHLIATKGRSL